MSRQDTATNAQLQPLAHRIIRLGHQFADHAEASQMIASLYLQRLVSQEEQSHADTGELQQALQCLRTTSKAIERIKDTLDVMQRLQEAQDLTETHCWEPEEITDTQAKA